MSDEGTFLARWSRRKRDAFTDTREQSKPESAAGGAPEIPPVSSAPGEMQPPFDLASLPPIESISAASDVRAFLDAGVPTDLARAALRRAWSSDPAIRDFVGLSENSWDFNAPGALPGFGPIDKEVVRRLVTQLMGEPDATAAAARPTIAVSQPDKAQERASESDPVEVIETIPGSAALAPPLDQRPQKLDTADATNDVRSTAKPPLHRNMNPPRANTAHQHHGAVTAVPCPNSNK